MGYAIAQNSVRQETVFLRLDALYGAYITLRNIPSHSYN